MNTIFRFIRFVKKFISRWKNLLTFSAFSVNVHINNYQAMPEEYKNPDPVKAYRTYYLNDKKDFAKWKLGNVPIWWNI